MDFLELAKKRYAARMYEERSVEKEKMDLILEAAKIAPTAGNRQEQKLLVVQDKEGLEKIKKAGNIYNAPAAIITCVNEEKAWIRPHDEKKYGIVDAAITVDHMSLEATQLELGSVWVCYFDPVILREEFKIPDGLEPVAILAIGYPASNDEREKTHLDERKSISDMLL